MPMAVPAAICHPAESQANHDPGSFQHYQAPFHSSAPVSGLPILSDSVIQALGSLADSREEDTFMRIADSIVGTNSNGNAALTLLNPQSQLRPMRPTSLSLFPSIPSPWQQPCDNNSAAALTIYNPVGNQPVMSWLYNPLSWPPMLNICNQEQSHQMAYQPSPLMQHPPALMTVFNQEQQQMAELQSVLTGQAVSTVMRPLARYPQTPLFDPFYPSPVIDTNRLPLTPKGPHPSIQSHFDKDWPSPVSAPYSAFTPKVSCLTPTAADNITPSWPSPSVDVKAETEPEVEAEPEEEEAEAPVDVPKRPRGRPKKVKRATRRSTTATPKAETPKGTKRPLESVDTPILPPAKRPVGRPKRTPKYSPTHDEETQDQYQPFGF